MLRSLEQTCKYKTIRIFPCDILRPASNFSTIILQLTTKMSYPLERKVNQLSTQMYVSFPTLQQTIICTESIRVHVLRALPAAASAAESELEEIASKNPFVPSKNQDSAAAKEFAPLEEKVEQMQAKLYVSYFILQEKIFLRTDKP